MPRPSTGQVLRDTRGGATTYALRFRAYGKRRYLTLGGADHGWTRERAQLELENVLADVRRGIWRPVEPPPAKPTRDPTFHEFATSWYEAGKHEWGPKTRLDYRWQLSRHLLPFFKDHRVSEITIAEVDRYRHAKVAEARATAVAIADGAARTEEYVDKNGYRRRRVPRPLSTTSINKTITRLAQILEVAVEYGVIAANPAKGRRRRLRAEKPAPVWLESAEQIEALLEAAGELDRHARATGGYHHRGGLAYRRALLATLVFAGLRIGELTALRWADIDLASGRLTVRASKTAAGVRVVDLLPVLHDELAAHKANAPNAAPGAFVFATAAGTQPKQDNIRRRVMDAAVARVNAKLPESGIPLLPEGLTPHKLRHTFASVLVATGVDPGTVMDQLGHTDAAFTLRVYRHGMRRDPDERKRLRALVGADLAAEPVTTGDRTGLHAEAASSKR
jgi:integrase